MRNYMLLPLFLLITLNIFSQGLITDTGIYPPPAPPALPAAGGIITDPVFGTEILRLTDEADGNDNEHGYSYWPCFNADNTIAYVYRVNGAATIYDLDAETFTISNKRNAFQTLIDGEYPLGEDQIWSRTDKNIIYCHTYKNLVAYNVTSQTYTILKNFDGLIPGNQYLWQMSCNHDATKFAFSKKRQTDYEVVGYLVWDAIIDSIYEVDENYIDEVQLDRTGNYLWIKTAMQGAGVIQAYITDLNTYLTEGLTDDGPDYAPGHGDVGHEFIIGVDNWENRLLYRNCADPHTYTEVWNFEGDWGQDMHISLLAENEDWVLVSCYMYDPGFPFTGLFENEIFQIATDGSKQVRRLCHHQSNYPISGGNYWTSPRASMSYDGQFVMFTSNWGDDSRTDVFILKILAEEDTTLAVSNHIWGDDLNIYPNPAGDILHVELPESGNGISVTIRDMSGREIFEQKYDSDNIGIELDKLPAGMYEISVFSATRLYVKKLIHL